MFATARSVEDCLFGRTSMVTGTCIDYKVTELALALTFVNVLSSADSLTDWLRALNRELQGVVSAATNTHIYSHCIPAVKGKLIHGWIDYSEHVIN